MSRNHNRNNNIGVDDIARATRIAEYQVRHGDDPLGVVLEYRETPCNPRFLFRPDGWPLLNQLALASGTPGRLKAMDVLLDGTYPGVDADVCGPEVLHVAATTTHLEVISHLFTRYGHAVKEWDDRTWQTVPAASRHFIDALTERQALVESLPDAAEPMQEKPRARRL
ncbi:hypothetical protein [Xanthomonas sp. NCPPB 2632]|uniref:hypothetical protein n=1 Tax=Xanthomonas sp. NCPPB 2632 TaxID=3240912 RepID=UPI003515AEAA